MRPELRRRRGLRISARLRLALSYAVFLVLAGAAALVGVYVVLRYVPNYPLTVSNPADFPQVASRREILDALLQMSIPILGGMALLGIVGGWLLAGRILRPLREINEAARIAATGRLDHRIRLGGRIDEFSDLADSFDHMLDRLHDAFATQERFAANASHELRTPLAVNATLIDVAQAAPDEQDYPQLLERLRITNDRAIGLTEALLRLADVNAITAVAEPVNLATIAADALDENADEAGLRRVSIESQFEDAPTTGDAALLTQMLANLLQNAIRHNHENGGVRLFTGHDAKRSVVTLRVENTGTVYTAQAATRLADPFLRGAGRVTGNEERTGYGLGLALVKRIATVHDGSLTISPRDGGGLVTTVELPAHGRWSRERTQDRVAS
ncbi:MAG TPA: HAMP domain-containing sensor histidine kinase [Solirubrobacterales bacterium]|nr:HAMP domain-containing sensor histidine kinase [Solirubrobacterales bacterium]